MLARLGGGIVRQLAADSGIPSPPRQPEADLLQVQAHQGQIAALASRAFLAELETIGAPQSQAIGSPAQPQAAQGYRLVKKLEFALLARRAADAEG